MNSNKSDKPGTGMNYVALRQTIQNRMLVIGGGPVHAEKSEEEPHPFREIDGVPVYHIAKTEFHLPMFEDHRWSIRPHRWGYFYHPFLMIGMPDLGGDVTLHVVTRFPGWYCMTATVKLDAWGNGASDGALDVVCWTPKVTGDNIERAGARLFKALVYKMDFVEEDEEQSSVYINEAWEDDWNATNNCLEIFREIRNVD